MRGLRKKRRLQVIAAAVTLLALATVLIGYAARDGIQFFRSPSQIVTDQDIRDGVPFRLGGLVEEGSLIVHDLGIRFQVTDGSHRIPVTFAGILPDLFREGQGVVALGTLDSGTFVATEILAKHDENYMPKEVIESLKEDGVYRPAN